MDDIGGEEDDLEIGLSLPKVALDVDLIVDNEGPGDDDEEGNEEEDEFASPLNAPKAFFKAEPVKAVSKAEKATPSTRIESEKTTSGGLQPAEGKDRRLAAKTGLAPARITASATKPEPKAAPAKAIPAPGKKTAPAAKPAAGKTQAKIAIKAPVKAAVKTAVKNSVKGSVKPKVKATVKASPAPIKANKKQIAASKPGKAGKAAANAAKKPGPHSGKKR